MHARLMEELERITLEERRILDGRAAIDRELYMEGTADTVSHQKLLASGRLIALRKEGAQASATSCPTAIIRCRNCSDSSSR